MTSTHPAAEVLVPCALGGEDAATARHVEACATCRTEIEQLQEVAGLARGVALLDRRTETPDCLDELTVADFVDGRMSPEARAPVIAHLLTCARCRSVVRATGRILANPTVTAEVRPRQWRLWSLTIGIAAAATVLLVLWPRGVDDTGSAPGLREPRDTSVVAPVLIAPRASVARVGRFVWSSVPGVGRYRIRLYAEDGTVLWTAESPDTALAAPPDLVLRPDTPYLWMVERQTEWRRWAASELVEFRVRGAQR